MLFFSIESILITRSIIVNPSPMAAFNITYYLEALVVNCIVILITFLFQTLASWTDEICPILHLIATIIILVPIVRFIPYYHALSNTFYEAILTAGAFSDLFFFVFYLIDSKHKSQVIPFAVILIAFVISFIVYFCVNKFYVIKKIEKVMNNRTFNVDISEDSENEAQNETQNYSEEDYVFYYSNYGLMNAPVKSLMYLYVSYSHYYYHFYDWSLLKFLMTKMPSNRVLIACIQFVSYFPSESRINNF